MAKKFSDQTSFPVGTLYNFRTGHIGIILQEQGVYDEDFEFNYRVWEPTSCVEMIYLPDGGYSILWAPK